VQLSTAGITLARVRDIIACARLQPKVERGGNLLKEDMQTSLSGCATILLGMALEQGIGNSLTRGSYQWTVLNEGDPLLDPFGALMGKSIHARMKELPEILSEGALMLNRKAPEYLALCNLIMLRNRLVHYVDKMLFAHSASGKASIKDGFIEATFPIPTTPWSALDVLQAEGFMSAVGLYFDKVLHVTNLEPGGLLRTRR